MGYIGSTEFGCKCGYAGHFRQEFHGSKVSDIATCPRCETSINVSRARGIEKWNSRLSFTLINGNSTCKVVARIGGTTYDVPPNEKMKVTHYGNDLFEYKDESGRWEPWSSVWYRCFVEEWSGEINMSIFAYHTAGTINSSRKTTWW